MENSVTDLIIRIKNGYMARKELIEAPFSRFREEVLKKLVKLKFIRNYKVKEVRPKVQTILIDLMYDDGQPALTDIRIFSKPGQRNYVSYRALKPILGGLGFSLLSTPKGILTNIEARKLKIGGELLFAVW